MPTQPNKAPTEQELEILRHTLGLKRGDVAYRNHFCADEGHDDMPILQSLETKGLMKRRSDPLAPGFVFWATAQGIEAARATGASRE